MVSFDLKWRNLNEGQRAMVAEKLATLGHGGDRSKGPIGPSLAAAGETLNVSRKSVQRARKVREHGDPALVSAVESGQKSVHAAEQEIKW